MRYNFNKKMLFTFFIINQIILSQFKVFNYNQSENQISFNIVLEKNSYEIIQENKTNKILFKEFYDVSEKIKPVLPSTTIIVAIPPLSKIKPTITKEDYNFIKDVIPLASPLLKLNNDSSLIYFRNEIDEKILSSELFPEKEVELIDYQWLGNFYCALIKINNYQYDWKNNEIKYFTNCILNLSIDETNNFKINNNLLNDYEKNLKNIIINYDDALKWRGERKLNIDNKNDWLNPNEQYFKLSLIQDGIYRITYNDLINYGIQPTSVAPKYLSILNKGNEIPIFFSGKDENKFDVNDYIEFYATKNYSEENYRKIVSTNTNYINYLNEYTDSSYYWLKIGNQNGKRINVKRNVNIIADTIKSNQVVIHQEKDVRLWYYDAVEPRVQLPNRLENKVWTWLTLGSSGIQTFNFSLKDILPNSDVNVIGRVISNAADISTNAHKIGVSLNSTKYQDSLEFDYKKTVNISLKLNSSFAKEGDNSVRIFGIKTKATFQQLLIDWVDLEYSRLNKAYNDTLFLTINNNVKNKLSNIEISNIENPNNIIIYKVYPNIYKIENFNYDTKKKNIVFSDTVSLGDKYILTNDKFTLKPKFIYKKIFENLRDINRKADNILISNKKLISSSKAYLEFIKNNYKVHSELFFIDDIYDEFSFGYPYPESIRDFLKYANNNWQKPSPAYLTLIGDANYDYKQIFTPAPPIRKQNLVPSFGNPVSDSWFTIFDENSFIPQMFVGRIPANNDDELYLYLEKHKKYLNRKYDIWNKTYMMFSGGDPSKISEIEQIRDVNNFILNSIINKPPISGQGKHFYKTINPNYNFSPYKPEDVKNAIENGAVVISYVGHSGTQTWDNGIVKVEDLKNSYNDRFTLISDFGCSTGRFAEPDVNAFGELFICQDDNGNAISYLGNSSFGYLSTSLTFPKIFYKKLLSDYKLNVAQTHLLSKLELFQNNGINDVTKAFMYCNLLFGDPLINLKLPEKPNIKLSNDLNIPTNINDQSDYVKINLIVENDGKAIDDSLHVLVKDYLNNNEIFQLLIKTKLPYLRDTLTIALPIKNKSGTHTLKINLDYQNKIDELNENDNNYEFNFIVYPSLTRNISANPFYGVYENEIKVLNPSLKNYNDEIEFKISENDLFNNYRIIKQKMDTLVTKLNISDLMFNKKYYWQNRINNSNYDWSQTNSFIKSSNMKYFYLPDSNIISKGVNLKYDKERKSIILDKVINKLEIRSAGSNEGKFASILFNGNEILTNTYFWGVATAIIDSTTLKPTNIRYFTYPNPPSGDSLKNYLDRLPNGTLVAMTICDDGAQSVLGYSGGTAVRKSIYAFGSFYIDSVRYRESWCMIGKKGSPKGSAIESYKKLFNGIASVNISKEVISDSGYVVLPEINNAKELKSISIDYNLNNGKIIVIPLITKNDNTKEKLNIDLLKNPNEIKNIDLSKTVKLELLTKLYSDNYQNSPELKSISVDLKLLPELAINYQTVSISKDTIELGEKIYGSIKLFNVGETTAKNFNVVVEVESKNLKEKIYEINIDSLQADSKKIIQYDYSTIKNYGDYFFNIYVDKNDNVKEIYKDNNSYRIPFYVKKNNNPAKLFLTIDGNDILDGDYVSSKPNIEIKLHDESLIPITDTSKISIYLNNKRISYLNNLNVKYSNTNPKMIVNYLPTLSDGEYSLKVVGRNATNDLIDSAGIVKKFVVKNSLELLNVYNYPNPMKDKTDFTFKLTTIPDELKIIIYTIAGRKIKEFKINSSLLKYDFNTINWDGRDDDGNKIANGIYLYKVILKKDDKEISKISKLAKVE